MSGEATASCFVPPRHCESPVTPPDSTRPGPGQAAPVLRIFIKEQLKRYPTSHPVCPHQDLSRTRDTETQPVQSPPTCQVGSAGTEAPREKPEAGPAVLRGWWAGLPPGGARRAPQGEQGRRMLRGWGRRCLTTLT